VAKYFEKVSRLRIHTPLILLALFLGLALTGCQTEEGVLKLTEHKKQELEGTRKKSLEIKTPLSLEDFQGEPKEWGEQVTGVKTFFETDQKEMALTFDACGGPYGSGYDETLISFLRAERIPATLFVNERWIRENEDIFLQLAADPLFQIENHGSEHLPLSVSGREAWGITGTRSAEEIYDEIMDNHKRVKELTGREMTFFRSGTAFYDEIAVELAEALGYTVVNFDILGDAGASFSKGQVKEALLNAQPGSIALLHMNQPASETAQGVIEAIPLLQEQGFQFVHLKDKQLK